MDRPGGGDQGDGDVGAVFPRVTQRSMRTCVPSGNVMPRMPAGRIFAMPGQEPRCRDGCRITAVLPPRGVRCHCASFPVSGKVTRWSVLREQAVDLVDGHVGGACADRFGEGLLRGGELVSRDPASTNARACSRPWPGPCSRPAWGRGSLSTACSALGRLI